MYILSPILFNLFLNELPLALSTKTTDPFILPNGTSLNCLLYADDLVIFLKSKFGLKKTPYETWNHLTSNANGYSNQL